MARGGDVVHVDQPVRRYRLGLPLERRARARSTSTWCCTSSWVTSPSSTSPAGAFCSRRAATLTASPVARFWSAVGSRLATISPVFTPVRTVISHAVEPLELLVELGDLDLHAVGRAYGPERVVLVGADPPEDRHDRVADVLLHLAAVTADLGGHRREVAGLDLVHRLGVDPAGQRGGVLEVGEQQRHRLADLARRQACLDDGAAGAGAAAGASAVSCDKGVPQYPHRRNFAGFSSPQDGHRTTSTSGEYLRTPRRLSARRAPRPPGRRSDNEPTVTASL